MVIDKFKYYRRQITDDKVKLTKAEFRSALNLFNQKVTERIIFDNYVFKMGKLGTVSLKKYKRDRIVDGKVNEKQSIDWPNTNKYGKVIYLMNEHTDGYVYSFDYVRGRNLKNLMFYKFVPSRANKRHLAQILKNPDVYGKIDAYIK